MVALLVNLLISVLVPSVIGKVGSVPDRVGWTPQGCVCCMHAASGLAALPLGKQPARASGTVPALASSAHVPPAHLARP